nr:MAG TPA: Major head protein [Caudoviricetes sp.]
MRRKLPMKLQIFAEPGGTDPGAQTPPVVQSQPGTAAATPQIDYDKLIQLVQGKQSVTEESVLKGYFKQQGLSKEEAEQAMATFKQQQAAQQPDVNALQTQAAQAQAMAQQKEVENQAILQAIQLGIDAKTVPYVLKLADLSSVTGQDGKINEESLKTALNKVLEDVPALKPTAEQTSGFRQIGASGSQQQTNTDDALKAAFGL